MGAKHGSVTWMELHSGDFAATQSFYERLFGWKFSTEMGDAYLMFEDTTGEVGGGFAKDTPVSAGSPLVYMWVDSIEKSLAQIAELGGTPVQGKTEIPTIGWWATFKDPSDNVLALYESANR